MSTTPVSSAPPRRVRHQARDAAAVMAFSLVLSLSCAVGFLLLAHLGR